MCFISCESCKNSDFQGKIAFLSRQKSAPRGVNNSIFEREKNSSPLCVSANSNLSCLKESSSFELEGVKTLVQSSLAS